MRNLTPRQRWGLGLLAALILICSSDIASASQDRRLKLGLVLSGGGARGLAHIGVLKVLEEAGLRPDCIAATSMGGIIGALYALGYNARQIEAIVLAQDWPFLLQDGINRMSLSFEDKRDAGKYLVAFPVSQGSLQLPAGMVSGQNVSTLLERLFFPVRMVKDFRRLPIPFACMATNIESGQSVVLDHGYLPEAVRATMSIPSMFTPVELDGRLLVDGGMLRDLPVSNAYAMGADRVIAVDVNFQLADRAKLNSLAKILDQSIMIYTLDANKKQAEKSQLLLQPQVGDFGLMSFDQARLIIDQGEAAARAHWTELQALAKALGRKPAPVPDLPDAGAQPVTVASLRIEGLHDVSEKFVLHQLDLDLPGRLTCTDIEKAVNRLYGSRYFQTVTYRFEPASEGEILVVRVQEEPTHYIRAGIHYDTELNAMLLMESSFRNLLSPGSELRLDAVLSKTVELDSSYFFQPGWKRGLGFGADLEYQGGGMAIYNVDKVKAYVNQNYWKADLVAQGTLLESLAFGVGLEKEIATADSTETTQNDESSYVETLNGLAYLRVDWMDRNFFPRQGGKADLTAKYMTDNLSLQPQEPFRPYYRLLLNATRVLPLFPSVSLAATVRGGATLGDTVNPAEWFYVGGMTGFERNKIPFVGMPNIEAAGPNVLIGHLGLQIEPWEDRFIILRANVGRTASHFEELFEQGELLVGYGLTLGALTVIGPVEATLMADKQGALSGFISIGYPF